MEPSTRILPAYKFSYDSSTKYITRYQHSFSFNVNDDRDNLVLHNGLTNCPPREFDIDLVSDQKKILIVLDDSFYHFFMDTIPSILNLHKHNPGVLLLIYTQDHKPYVFSKQAEQLLKLILDGEGVNYRFISVVNDYEYAAVVKANNIAFAPPYFSHENFITFQDVNDAVKLVVKYAKRELGAENKKPDLNKKVFITGKPTTFFDFDMESLKEYNGYTDDERMYNREKLETFFSKLGYEVVNPVEDFDSLFEQIVYMSDVQTLAAVTCSGLVNMIFMDSNKLVIEIQAELVQNMPKPGEENPVPLQGVHSMYSMLTYMKDHLLISVPSHRDPIKVIQRIRQSKVVGLL